jgi:putative addiction module component (TIGR02574 family)
MNRHHVAHAPWHPSLQFLCPLLTVPTVSPSLGVVAMAPMSDLLQLPPSERLALAIALWDSLDNQARDGALPVNPALCAELDRRWANHRDDPEAAVPWDEVRSQLGIG